MSTSRNRLHQNKLQAFADFCNEQGWSHVPLKSPFEVLRMRNPGVRDPLIVYKRLEAKEHLTTHGPADAMVSLFLDQPHYDRRINLKPVAEHASDDVPWE